MQIRYNIYIYIYIPTCKYLWLDARSSNLSIYKIEVLELKEIRAKRFMFNTRTTDT